LEELRRQCKERFVGVQPLTQQLLTRQAKIDAELKSTQEQRAAIAAAITKEAERLHQAVTARHQRLLQDLEKLAAVKTEPLSMQKKQCGTELSRLDYVQKTLKQVSQEDDDRAFTTCVKLLESGGQTLRVMDTSPISQIPFMWNVSGSELAYAIWKWGYVDFRQPHGLTFQNGCLHWSPMSCARGYQVQMQRLGEVGEGHLYSQQDVNPDYYRSLWQDDDQGRYWTKPFVPCTELGLFGVYAVRVRALDAQGWGPNSEAVLTFDYPVVTQVNHDLRTDTLSWRAFKKAMKYEVQMAGPWEENKNNSSEFETIFLGGLPENPRVPIFTDKGCGEFVVRVRALFQLRGSSREHWGPYSTGFRFSFGRSGAEVFQATNPQHRVHLLSCLPTIPDVLVEMIRSYVPLHGWGHTTPGITLGFDSAGRKSQCCLFVGLIGSLISWLVLVGWLFCFEPLCT